MINPFLAYASDNGIISKFFLHYQISMILCDEPAEDTLSHHSLSSGVSPIDLIL